MTTIVNSTDSTLSVRYGGISVDGHPTSPLWVVPAGKKLNKRERKGKPDVVELGKIHCFTSGFLSSDNFFSANASSQVLTVVPRTALTVSSVILIRSDAPSRVATLPGRYAITLESITRILHLSGPVDLQFIVARERFGPDKRGYRRSGG
jgi:hypothetical protein